MRIVSMCVVLCVSLLLVTGCAEQPATPASSGAPAATAPATNAQTAAGAAAPVTVPEPSSNEVGTVGGRVININEVAGRTPVTGFAVYLGTILKSDQGVEGLVELDRGKAPKAMPDANGTFAFTDVPPGRYGLMLETPQGAILLNKPVSGNALIVEVKGGEVLNLGELEYDLGDLTSGGG